MKRSFTARELLLICIAVVMALGIFYYEFVYKGFSQSVEQYNVANLDDELTLVQMKAADEAQMKLEIKAASGTKKAEVAIYNNLANEVSTLGTILNGNAENVSITWSAPTVDDSTVRRQAAISFKTGDYASAKALVQAISDAKYRNIISNLSLNNNTSGNDTSTSVSLTLTFFETTVGASSTEGLIDTTSSN